MVDMTGKILVKEEYIIIHNSAEVSETLKGLVHPTVVVFTDGGEAKRCTHELIASKRHDEGSEELTVFLQSTLMITFEVIQDHEVLGFGPSNISDYNRRRCGLESFTLDKAREVNVYIAGCVQSSSFVRPRWAHTSLWAQSVWR